MGPGRARPRRPSGNPLQSAPGMIEYLPGWARDLGWALPGQLAEDLPMVALELSGCAMEKTGRV